MTNIALCRHCGSDRINKAGFTKNRKQRYYCRSCRRFSRENPIVKVAGKAKAGSRELPSKSHLILQLRAIAQRLKRTPTTGDITELSKVGRAFSLKVYYDVFGSFTKAIRKARLKSRYIQQFDKEELIGELRILRRKLRRALIARDVTAARKRGEVSSVYHFQRAFGSIPKAIAAAGAGRSRFTRPEIIAYLNNLHSELERVPTGKDISNRFVPGETPSLKEIMRMFASLRKARKASGIAYRKGKGAASIYWRKYTPEELLGQMRRVAKKVGRPPTDRDLNRASKEKESASPETFRRAFGNLQEARWQMDSADD